HAVFLLIGFHDRDQRAADRRAGAVQRMNETRLAIGPARTRVHPPCLEVAAHRATRNFAVSAAFALTRKLSWHPDLDVVGLLRGRWILGRGWAARLRRWE